MKTDGRAMEIALEVVLAEYGVSRERFLGRGRFPAEVAAREAFAFVAAEACGCNFLAVTRFLGGKHESTRRYQITRARLNYAGGALDYRGEDVRAVYDQLVTVTGLRLKREGVTA